MKLCIISDTHSLHNGIKTDLPEADCLIHCGDLENGGRDIQDVWYYAKWLATQKHKYKKIIQIAGNHDGSFETFPKPAQQILFDAVDNLVYLENSSYVYEGIKFYGSPITPTFGHWFFMKERGTKIKEIWDQIPLDTNVLITHGPPYNTLDEVEYPAGLHVGCEELAKRIKQLNHLKLHAFGHIHCGNGMVEKNSVTYINAAICNEQYKPVQTHYLIEI